MIDGNVLNGWLRGIHAFLTISMVAVGLLFAMLITRKTSAKDLKFSLRRK